jgi:hypothetical protein
MYAGATVLSTLIDFPACRSVSEPLQPVVNLGGHPHGVNID